MSILSSYGLLSRDKKQIQNHSGVFLKKNNECNELLDLVRDLLINHKEFTRQMKITLRQPRVYQAGLYPMSDRLRQLLKQIRRPPG